MSPRIWITCSCTSIKNNNLIYIVAMINDIILKNLQKLYESVPSNSTSKFYFQARTANMTERTKSTKPVLLRCANMTASVWPWSRAVFGVSDVLHRTWAVSCVKPARSCPIATRSVNSKRVDSAKAHSSCSRRSNEDIASRSDSSKNFLFKRYFIEQMNIMILQCLKFGLGDRVFHYF